ncbi:unnamed protein product [Protopolystoma xenopodis]|uniref:Uncharacterized protein n=1 Tax=Protopolystoma xenopodis TaxID=117903 RepID=A0A448XF41_9PLAT|nr:unnamed protein product [Protopolystoma xenopodis]
MRNASRRFDSKRRQLRIRSRRGDASRRCWRVFAASSIAACECRGMWSPCVQGRSRRSSGVAKLIRTERGGGACCGFP